MSEAIVVNGVKLPDTFTVSKAKQVLDESQRLYLHGVQHGWVETLYKAAALCNIHSLGVHAAEGRSWQQQLSFMGVSERSAQQHLRIGRMMQKLVVKQCGIPESGPFVFTQANLKTTFEGYFKNGHVITQNLLAKYSGNLEEFRAYLAGEIELDEKQATKLLQSANVLSDREAARKELGEGDGEQLSSSESFHRRMEADAERLGFKWDRELNDFFNLDGTELTEAQRAELKTPEEALQLLLGLRIEVSSTVKKSFDFARKTFDNYRIYREHLQSTRFEQEALQLRDTITTKLRILDGMVNALVSGDFDRAEELFKEGVEG